MLIERTDKATIVKKELTPLSKAMLSELDHRRCHGVSATGRRLWCRNMTSTQKNVARSLLGRGLVDYGTDNGGWYAINGAGIERHKREIRT